MKIKPQYKISTFLPDNPEVKKIEEFTYNKKIDALEFLEKSFFSLHDFIEELASEFGFKEMSFQLKANLGSYGDLINRRGTIALAIYDTKNPEALHIAHENGKVFLNLIKP